MVTSYTPLTTALNGTSGSNYSASDMSVTTGLTAGDYTVDVAAATTGSGYTVKLTDPSGKTYSTTSSDGSATFKTSSGTITLAAPSTGFTAGTTTFTVSEDTANTVTFDSTPTLTVASTTNATNAVPVKLDLSAITSTGTSTSKLTIDEDGYEAGTFTGSYTIANDGTISASYSNGKTLSVGQIGLAVFENANGLEKVGSNFYTTTTNSGDCSYVVAGKDGSGTMQSYALELSNVDLASQFSAMMISQRAYQANTKVISTASDMLQSLINMVG
jgi:flagellar hook protein FlgE